MLISLLGILPMPSILGLFYYANLHKAINIMFDLYLSWYL